MKNYENYETEIKKLRDELDKKEEVIEIIKHLQEKMQWDAMIYIEDDSKKGYHFEEPIQEDNRCIFARYEAYKEIIDLIEKKYFK